MIDMEITYTVFNRSGIKSDQRTGKALRGLTADEVTAWLTTCPYHNISQFTIVGTNGNRIPVDYWMEGDR